MKVVHKFYNTSAWKNLRALVLRQAEYKDQLEARTGRNVPATMVHHIFPRDKYPEYELERWNCIAVSDETHELLHIRATNGLSPLGWELLFETAEKNNIPISRLFLVIGMPGSGKTTYVKQHLRNGLAFDLDHLSAAFRLSKPHEDTSASARKMAASMVIPFARNARRFAGLVYLIRTAPTIDEFQEISPDAVIICNHRFNISKRKDYQKVSKAREEEMQQNIDYIRGFCKDNNIDVIEV